MITFRHNKILLLFLLIAFITAQWAVTHIHLAEHHDHDGNNHQHNIQAHTHSTSDYSVDTIDSGHVIDDNNVVDLDNDCALPASKKLGDQSIVSNSTAHQILFSLQSTRIKLPELDSNKQNYITYSTIRLRAPPKFS